MRKFHKQQLLEIIQSLHILHKESSENLAKKDYPAVQSALSDCQEAAIQIGEAIEQLEGTGTEAVTCLEKYCEKLYQINTQLEEISDKKYYKSLEVALIKAENAISHMNVRIEAVFLPYKASMWDSLESVWKAADADPDCDAYVIPIPYLDRNPDGSFREVHYEGDKYPAYVPITQYDEFDFGVHRPDMIYIHNPYDYANHVTSVHPFFYSDNLKKYTDCLVYIPYYATAGGMSEGQSLCPAYINTDYIVIQSEKYRKFFDERLPDEKFLPLGSPKFDSIIHKCQNPPESPEGWEEKMKGRKVYFYNTSINGMLENTEIFLKKMRYVFDIFKGRDDACLLWRPHPLLESTFNSMRNEFKPQYDALKKEFIEENLGIYDETQDIEKTIALSDVYIGDAGTSVTSLFGVVGKPLFIFDNYINTLPEKDDWRGEKVNPVFDGWGNDRYKLINNQLWYSEKNDYHYKFYMDLGLGYYGGGYYSGVVELGNRIYIIPVNAQNLLIIEDKKIRRIDFKHVEIPGGCFRGYVYTKKYIFIFPFKYPSVIRFEIATDRIDYVDDIQQFSVRNVENEWCCGGRCRSGNMLIFASPVDNRFLFMDIDTLETRELSSNSPSNLGIQTIIPDGDDLWLLPINGMTITRWNPKTGDVREYDGPLPENFRSIKWPYEIECEESPFGNIAFSKEGDEENIVISPSMGNMYISLDRKSGEMREWIPPIPFTNRKKDGYLLSGSMGGFVISLFQRGKADCRIWYAPERKLYSVNIDTKEYEEIKIEFDYEELREHEPGFMEESEWLQYCLRENAFNSLKDLLDNNIAGNQFDRERQIKAFTKINANTEGTCGVNVYNFAKGKIL